MSDRTCPHGREPVLSSDRDEDTEFNQLFKILSDHRRRFILLSLYRDTIETKTDVMVQGCFEPRTDDITLVHIHLPKLANAGYIEWDRDTDEIAKGPRFDEIESFLHFLERYPGELPTGWK